MTAYRQSIGHQWHSEFTDQSYRRLAFKCRNIQLSYCEVLPVQTPLEFNFFPLVTQLLSGGSERE